MRTSTIATSGTDAPTCSIRSSASWARPTTVWPASRNSEAMPSRRSASSSATRIRRPVGSADGLSAGVTSRALMAASGANRGPGTDASDLGRVEHAVALIVAETEQPVEVYDAALKAIGEALGWRLGAVWEVDPRTRRLHCARTWHAGERAQEFEALSGALTLSPGVGLPGRVLESGQPAWLVDAPEDANFPRAQAAQRGGLHAGFAFPLRSPRGVVGVMEFFTGELREPDHRLLATMDTLGSQIGQFVAGLRAAEELRARESRLSAMLDAALDAVVTMDAGGRVIGWNRAA